MNAPSTHWFDKLETSQLKLHPRFLCSWLSGNLMIITPTGTHDTASHWGFKCFKTLSDFESSPALLFRLSLSLSLSLESYIVKIPRLCKFCDVRATRCAGVRSCKVECDITSICPDKQDVCVSIW